VAARGHELGNHTLFHPCEGKARGREWVKPEEDLNSYTVGRMVNEIETANALLAAIDGKSLRTFAYPCGDRKAGDSSYVEEIKKRFAAARGVEGKMQKINEIDPYDVGAYVINGQSGSELISMVEEAMEKNALLVFLFHGVGGEHDLNVSLDAHRQLLHFLRNNRNKIWVAPLIDIAQEVKVR
jgi:sialate O-acetylesterase